MNRQVLYGMLIGFLCNLLGFMIVLLIFSTQDTMSHVVQAAIEEGYLGKLISFASVINILPFFFFISKRKDNKAKGVLFATILVAILMIVIKFM